MGVLCDRQIKARCMRPEYFLRDPALGFIPVIRGVTHHVDYVDNLISSNNYRLQTVESDADLERYGWKPMIKNFQSEPKRTEVLECIEGRFDDDCGEDIPTTVLKEQRIISYGVSSYGYDCRLSSRDLKIFSDINSTIIDPMNVDPASYAAPQLHTDDDTGYTYFIQPPKSVSLGHTVEWFDISRDILVACMGKSTYARVGVSVIVTPLEPEWDGNLVLEIVNNTTSPVKIYVDQGIAQLVFHVGDQVCDISYKDRGGKYMGQKGTQDAIV